MASIQVRQLVSPSDAEIDQATQVLTDGFAKDPLVNALVGGDRTLDFKQQRSMITAGLTDGEVWVASYGDVEYAGVAIWYGPGQEMFGTDEARKDFNTFFEGLSPTMKEWWMEVFLVNVAELEKAFGDNVKLGNWHLHILGVSPKLHGKGIGKALLRHGEERAFKVGKAVALETESESNVAMYEHWGFVQKGKRDVEGPAGVPGFPFYAMLKSPPSA